MLPAKASAIWLLPELWTQTNRTLFIDLTSPAGLRVAPVPQPPVHEGGCSRSQYRPNPIYPVPVPHPSHQGRPQGAGRVHGCPGNRPRECGLQRHRRAYGQGRRLAHRPHVGSHRHDDKHQEKGQKDLQAPGTARRSPTGWWPPCPQPSPAAP